MIINGASLTTHVPGHTAMKNVVNHILLGLLCIDVGYTRVRTGRKFGATPSLFSSSDTFTVVFHITGSFWIASIKLADENKNGHAIGLTSLRHAV